MSKSTPTVPDELMSRVDAQVAVQAQHALYGTANRRSVFLHALALGLEAIEDAAARGEPPPAPRVRLPPAIPTGSIPTPIPTAADVPPDQDPA